jgi:hypothetical protein
MRRRGSVDVERAAFRNGPEKIAVSLLESRSAGQAKMCGGASAAQPLRWPQCAQPSPKVGCGPLFERQGAQHQ